MQLAWPCALQVNRLASQAAATKARAWFYMNDEGDDVDFAVIAMMYDEDNLSKLTSGDKPKHTRRGHLRVTRRTPAIAKLIKGAMTARVTRLKL